MLGCLALGAQTTEIKFTNSSSSDEIIVRLPELFGEDLIISKNEVVSVKVDNEKLTSKSKQPIEVFYPYCGNTEKSEITIGKFNKIGNLSEPCSDAKIKNCDYPEGQAYIRFINGTEKEISILDGPLNGLSLSPNQESQIIGFPVGRNSLIIESFLDTADHNKGVDKRNFKFFAIQDSSCLCKVVIRIIDDTKPEEDARAKLSIYVENRTDRKISITSSPFERISLLPGRSSSKKDLVYILSGFYPVTIEYLDNFGNKVSKEVLKHLVEDDKVLSINQKDLGIEAIPKIKNYNYKIKNSRSTKNYFSRSY
ncbi:MAG: hypothetical protein PHR57_03530 [Patescibacteria group bacterium]|nr:hypothetical protein [Patescibacteria group bacterium]